MFTTRASGKVILLGEHAVVYGVQALCGALARGVAVEVVAGEGRLRIPEWDLVTPPCASPSAKDGDASLFRAFQETASHAFGAASRPLLAGALPFDFIARFGIPAGAGLGSSAALSVALAKAIDRAASLGLSQQELADAALAAERVFHGAPSGLDHTVALLGGFGLYRRDRGFFPLEGTTAVRLCVADTGKTRDTKGRVARVAELTVERPAMTRAAFSRIETLVELAVTALRTGDFPTLGALMDENQSLLGQLEVSCDEIEAACEIARGAGALGAKLTGGGGGGCVIALAPDKEPELLAAWRAKGIHCFVADVGGGRGDDSP